MTLLEAQAEIAKKYRLGKMLVTGHAKTYWDEATMLYTNYHVKAALEAASYAARGEADYYRGRYTGHAVIDKNSILNAYKTDLIK